MYRYAANESGLARPFVSYLAACATPQNLHRNYLTLYNLPEVRREPVPFPSTSWSGADL